VLIRREVAGDAPAIRAVHRAAFAGEAEARLVDGLHAADDVVLSLVAELDGTVVGHVVGSRAWIGERGSVGLGPVGVLPAYQRRGVGSALMHAVLGAADALELPEVVLLGDPAYYRRFGFRLAPPLGVLPPDPAWAEHFQIRTLTAWNEDRRGAFRYAPAFDDV